jgi:hypothetical protein
MDQAALDALMPIWWVLIGFNLLFWPLLLAGMWLHHSNQREISRVLKLGPRYRRGSCP